MYPLFTTTTIMTTSLDQLKQTGTVVVSDSGDFECKLSSPREFVILNPSNLSDRCLQATGKLLDRPCRRKIGHAVVGCDNQPVLDLGCSQ